MPSTNGHGPKRAILYARVSTAEQARSGYSPAQQIEALRAYAAREAYEVLEEVVDAGQSGASLERPGMDRVRDLIAGGGVYVVLAQDRDRFAREPAYHYLLRREFEEHGTKIRALNDRGDDSPEGDLTDGILDQLAKYERAKMTERSRRGKLRKARGQGDSGAHGSLWLSLLRLRIKRCSRRADRGRGEDGGRTASLSHGWRRGTAYQRGEADA
jgi:DNA invertase Pin-like site-specific DNA recombinase